MKIASKLKLTKRTPRQSTICAILLGFTSERFLNRFLEDFLVEELEYNDGAPKLTLATSRFKNRRKAERLAAWMLKRYNKNNHYPGDKFEVGVVESGTGEVPGRYERVCAPANVPDLGERRGSGSRRNNGIYNPAIVPSIGH
jgi:hypothetical protein